MSVKPFVLSDGRVINSYGFRVRTSGINFTRFDANPVMLAEHNNSIDGVIGRWIDRQLNGVQLLATPEFDDADEDAAKIKGKVEREFLKGASIGIGFSYDKMEQMPDGVWELTECELFEASICAIPSNRSALRLYDQTTGKLLTADEVKLSIANLSADPTQKLKTQNTGMKKVILSLSALVALDLQKANTPEGVDADMVSAGIVELSTKLTKLQGEHDAQKLAYEALKKQVDETAQKETKELLDAAVLAGKFPATEREGWEKMAKADFSLTKKTLESLKGKETLSDKVDNPGGAGEVKTQDDFEKLTDEQKLAFKANHPDAYQKLFAA